MEEIQENDGPAFWGVSVVNVHHMALFLGAHETWLIEVDWVRVWEYED